MVSSEIMDDDEAENTSATGEQPSTATDLPEGAKDEAGAIPPPATEPSPDDIPSDTSTSTASS